MSEYELEVSELFYTIQGEGPNIGKPAVFLRLAGCNFHCKWKLGDSFQQCDTEYAKGKGTNYGYVDVMHRVRGLIPPGNRAILVITGGEPVIQSDALGRFLNQPREGFDNIDIETNGTLPGGNPTQSEVNYWIQLFDHYVVSPKPETLMDNIRKISRSLHNDKIYFKFVYDGQRETLEFIKEVIMKMEVIKHDHIYLMSAGCTYEELHDLDLKTVELCKRYGFMFTPRLQSYLWGKKRGV